MSALETVISSVIAIFPSNPKVAFDQLNAYLAQESDSRWREQGLSIFNLFFIIHNLGVMGTDYDQDPIKKYYVIFFGKEPSSEDYLKALENELGFYLFSLKCLNPRFVTEEVRDVLKKQFLLKHKFVCAELLSLYKQNAYDVRDSVKQILLEVIKLIEVQASFAWKAEVPTSSGLMMNRDLVFNHSTNKLTNASAHLEGSDHVIKY